MELLHKSVIHLKTITTEPIFNLEVSDKLPEYLLDNDIYIKLNKYKNMINNIENIKIWDFCKKLSNEYELLHHCIKNKHTNLGVANYGPISRSFFKMWEICRDLGIIDDSNNTMTYGALAEGPGGFIECFNFYRRRYCVNPRDNIKCITLRPYNNDIPGWKKSHRIFKECAKYKISFGKDDTGDLYNVENIIEYAKLFDTEKADLVTGDGGFDFSDDYSNQEISAFRLIFCEAVAGISILKRGGNMVLKLFDLFHQCSIDLIYILCYFFKDVYIIKPFTSRSANSEKYIICKHFKTVSQEQLSNLHILVDELAIISKQNKYPKRIISNSIPGEFIDIIQASNIFFISKQIKSLIKGLSYVKDHLNNDDINEIKQQQTVYSLAWCQKYNFPINTRCRFLNNINTYNYIPNF